MRFLNLYLSVLINAFFMFSIVGFVHADSIDDIRVIKISPKDKRAIIKTTERELKIIKVGDILRVAGERVTSYELGKKVTGSPVTKYGAVELKVVEIVKGRVVFEEETDSGIETVIIRLKNGKQTVERIKKTADKQPLLYAPQLDTDKH